MKEAVQVDTWLGFIRTFSGKLEFGKADNNPVCERKWEIEVQVNIAIF